MRPPERLPPHPWLHLPGHLHPRICVQCCQPRGPVTQGDEVSILLVNFISLLHIILLLLLFKELRYIFFLQVNFIIIILMSQETISSQ